MINVINKRIQDIKGNIKYLEESKEKTVDSKFNGNIQEWDRNMEIIKAQLEELENCIKINDKNKNKEYNKIKRKQHEKDKQWANWNS